MACAISLFSKRPLCWAWGHPDCPRLLPLTPSPSSVHHTLWTRPGSAGFSALGSPHTGWAAPLYRAARTRLHGSQVRPGPGRVPAPQGPRAGVLDRDPQVLRPQLPQRCGLSLLQDSPPALPWHSTPCPAQAGAVPLRGAAGPLPAPRYSVAAMIRGAGGAGSSPRPVHCEQLPAAWASRALQGYGPAGGALPLPLPPSPAPA